MKCNKKIHLKIKRLFIKFLLNFFIKFKGFGMGRFASRRIASELEFG